MVYESRKEQNEAHKHALGSYIVAKEPQSIAIFFS